MWADLEEAKAVSLGSQIEISEKGRRWLGSQRMLGSLQAIIHARIDITGGYIQYLVIRSEGTFW